MTPVALYLVTAVLFLAVDAIMLKTVLRPVFEAHLGEALLDDLRLGPAALFYLFYVGGLVWFVSLPALREGAVGQAFLNGALLGALAYGTYEFTNFATLRDWSWKLVLLDLTWGTLLTGGAAAAGVALLRLAGRAG
ncbi:DUF2177 family protein [Pseudooceanicola aestuarii]|uniref:DUF2177 family protein n=1 Tax=Pseudooceanicola aestuarii TaxID=2697319 RepID=UPI0013D8978A|nr:DUF2177 family protein [Pseudooceanicola aestuarii]